MVTDVKHCSPLGKSHHQTLLFSYVCYSEDEPPQEARYNSHLRQKGARKMGTLSVVAPDPFFVNLQFMMLFHTGAGCIVGGRLHRQPLEGGAGRLGAQSEQFSNNNIMVISLLCFKSIATNEFITQNYPDIEILRMIVAHTTNFYVWTHLAYLVTYIICSTCS